ncbi:hypothetical protein [Pantoea sp. UBA6567]|uniref:hypothetical protein n=1 Tax=Pantoea sp. UBA6567 TaxID=1947043 RepID=UPI00259AB2CF|nr:hypothetical protein [Pantoea sp. UBA6567]
MNEDLQPDPVSKEDYHLALRELDIAVCEAKAVSNAIGTRQADKPNHAWSTYIFLRICINAGIMIANVPGSRWVKKDYELWDFSSVAPQARAIMEARLLLFYISKENKSDDEWRVKLNTMHMNDCMKRIDMFSAGDNTKILDFYLEQKQEIESVLMSSDYFQTLDNGTRKRILAGKIMTIQSRDELIQEIGDDPDSFRKLFDFLSHYTHILPMSYYKAEANGRGTGCFNIYDHAYIYMAMILVKDCLVFCTDIICEMFPDTSRARKGLKSKITIGPKPRK